MKKESVNGFVWIAFQEHPIVDCEKHPFKPFDITSKGNKTFSSDFMRNGSFDHNQYCKCLIETAFELRESHLSPFLDYQCVQLDAPHKWLMTFRVLLDDNQKMVKRYPRQLRYLKLLLEEKMELYSGFTTKRKLLFFEPGTTNELDERFDIVKVRKQVEKMATRKEKKAFLHRLSVDYLQEVEDNEEALFITGIKREIHYIDLMAKLERDHMELTKKESTSKATSAPDDVSETKKITFFRKPIVLADLIWQLKELRDKEGNSIFDASTMDYARFICNNFCKEDGTPFSENSMRTYFTHFQNRKRASKKSQIDISEIKLLED